MKAQFLITCIMALSAVSTAKPLEERGLAGNLVKTVKELLHHGIGTFFDPETEGGAQGACGPFADENSQIVAMNKYQYGNMNKKSHWCGKKLKICHKKKCTIATVTDACPTCDHGCLDLTPAVWGQLEDDFNKGIIPIDWEEYNGDDEDYEGESNDEEGSEEEGSEGEGNDDEGNDDEGNDDESNDDESNDDEGSEDEGSEDEGCGGENEDNEGEDNEGEDNEDEDNEGEDNEGEDNEEDCGGEDDN